MSRQSPGVVPLRRLNTQTNRPVCIDTTFCSEWPRGVSEQSGDQNIAGRISAAAIRAIPLVMRLRRDGVSIWPNGSSFCNTEYLEKTAGQQLTAFFSLLSHCFWIMNDGCFFRRLILSSQRFKPQTKEHQRICVSLITNYKHTFPTFVMVPGLAFLSRWYFFMWVFLSVWEVPLRRKSVSRNEHEWKYYWFCIKPSLFAPRWCISKQVISNKRGFIEDSMPTGIFSVRFEMPRCLLVSFRRKFLLSCSLIHYTEWYLEMIV